MGAVGGRVGDAHEKTGDVNCTSKRSIADRTFGLQFTSPVFLFGDVSRCARYGARVVASFRCALHAGRCRGVRRSPAAGAFAARAASIPAGGERVRAPFVTG
ncbi:hypothetical protein [Burkholderia sp. ABCPW 111]|uniref:hypothetical protein n=1 Tax=Burkholderia sp. ABCPW 111 TaxID=1820025 RepID=UPI00126A49E9|nr:hypothetical protein [Burkholderia sp. ABCPW 111]